LIVGCGDLTILLLGLGFHCFLFRKRKTASQPWQAIAQRFCSIGICKDGEIMGAWIRNNFINISDETRKGVLVGGFSYKDMKVIILKKMQIFVI